MIFSHVLYQLSYLAMVCRREIDEDAEYITRNCGTWVDSIVDMRLAE